MVDAPAAASDAPELVRERRWADVCWLLLAVLLAVVFADQRYDDAYITFRYGENIARGRGPVFNPGERVLGTTSPGQMLISAVAHRVVGHDAVPSAMSILGCLALGVQAACAFRLLRPLSRWAAWGAGAVLVLGAGGGVEWVSLETQLALAAVLATMVAAVDRRFALAAALAAVAGLLRPDNLIVAGLLALYVHERGGWRAIWRPAATFLTLTLPWPLFATWYYGSPLPQSLSTKFQRAGGLEYLSHLLISPPMRLAEQLGTAELRPPGVAPDGALLLAVVVWVMALGGALRLARSGEGRWIVPGFLVVHMAAYAYLRPFVAHWWHIQPEVTLLACLVCVELGVRSEDAARVPRLAGRLAIGCLWLLTALGTLGQAFSHGTDYWHGGRDEAYRQAAAWVAPRLPPGKTVAAVEVGTLAYLGDFTMVDLGGLVTRPSQLQANLLRAQWAVLDPLYERMAGARPAAAVFTSGGFQAKIFDVGAEPASPLPAPVPPTALPAE
jgi:hypothetical protein